jgi:hypothetical protein
MRASVARTTKVGCRWVGRLCGRLGPPSTPAEDKYRNLCEKDLRQGLRLGLPPHRSLPLLQLVDPDRAVPRHRASASNADRDLSRQRSGGQFGHPEPPDPLQSSHTAQNPPGTPVAGVRPARCEVAPPAPCPRGRGGVGRGEAFPVGGGGPGLRGTRMASIRPIFDLCRAENPHQRSILGRHGAFWRGGRDPKLWA